jgi:hypothetical protein
LYGADPSTLAHKLIMGYQGWFACPGDGRPGEERWVHWFANNRPTTETTTVDLLPDVSELGADERCPTPWVARNGRPVQLYSAQNPKTVARHFQWMKEYEIDGVALQRFVVGLRPSRNSAANDHVLDNVRRAAEATGRVWFVMYDVAGADPATWAELLEQDWTRLEGEGITRSPGYQRHRGHPVLAIAGIGSNDRPADARTTARLLASLRKISQPNGGLTIMGSLPTGWRTLDRDAIPDPAWTAVYRSLDIISPWTVGRFKDEAGADRFRKERLEPDMAEAKRLGIDYMPVIFPGFSWVNLMTFRKEAEKRHSVTNQIPRQCGRFYWRQVANAVDAGATMLYGAMFDEVDEGTAMFKIVANKQDLPAEPPFVSLDADGCALPSDWYLQLAGKATAMLQGRMPVSFEMPLRVK